MELTERVALVAITATGGTLARHGASSLGDAGAPCLPIVLLHRHARRFAWN